MRLIKGEEKHAEWLRGIGEGTSFIPDSLHVELPLNICMPNERSITEWLYDKDLVENAEKMGKVALLTVRHNYALELNELVLEEIPGETVYLFEINTPAPEEDGYNGMPCDDEEYLHKLTPSGMPKYRIFLKKGAIIMLLRNIDVSGGLCNGTRLEVLSVMCDNRLLYCRNLLYGRNTFLTRMPLTKTKMG
ncbi:hypothetical protein OESDEN_11089 [Oesophagostomum dentatum]|uniref:DNA helicase Pif1-like 2B domain-containing protein n=1 Tax=Oesophagostomum dentatum TaxID=61180 RepID=A0A0B1SVW9_OESDE|nr:hypothetical protein OESDEN_11089 [Oesophagostomum dentatum]